MHEHPSQALLDLRTLLFALGLADARRTPRVTPALLSGFVLTICGDILHSRVARSNALLLARLGARVLLCGPEALLPDAAAELMPAPAQAQVSLRAATGRARREGGIIEIDRSLESCLRQSHAVMMLRIQRERFKDMALDLDAYIANYQLNSDRFPLLSSGISGFAGKGGRRIVLHPGPLVRGLEITSEVADGAESVILDQVSHGLAVRRAILLRALAGKRAA